MRIYVTYSGIEDSHLESEETYDFEYWISETKAKEFCRKYNEKNMKFNRDDKKYCSDLMTGDDKEMPWLEG
jgi:hypothetical protein